MIDSDESENYGLFVLVAFELAVVISTVTQENFKLYKKIKKL